ncbi:hypothetical protein TAGGR_2364 [Thermodesulfovibrio aggregans]|uniref:DUF3782 domain-containing protein n=1 Tax=Thermodesulfovibrio aggregans TaxID=86166 RepID=A0A0U9HXQ4_9BACT|nr:DUF3782 domain-containing protein [Thermodesulfovibrio aggregans]GAQ95471.1 hypothetical protein TAGGR_2364 [Thermodesulfovibrio aggregans]
MKKSEKQLKKEEIKQLIIAELPKLMKRDAQTRELIYNLMKERFADKRQTEDRFEKILRELQIQREESEKKWAEWNRKWEENQKKWEENEKKWEENQKRWEENQRKWEENQRVINSILQEIKLLHRKHDSSIGALGARWGLIDEATFREAMKGILEENFPIKVTRYCKKDTEGEVFGRPDQIELDLIIRDGEVIVAEIKSSTSKGDVATFLRKLNFYEKNEGKKVHRKIIISPMIENAAKEFALSYGIEVYGYPEEVEFKEMQSSN